MQRRLPTRLAASLAALALTVALATTTASCTPSDSDVGDGPVLSLVGFAVPNAANDAIQELWADTPEGENVKFESSYGPSGDQSRAVENGTKADYVHFSLEGDVTRLVKAGLVAEDWNAGPNQGIVSRSVVVLVVREGNPKNIQGWDDIVKPGIGIVTPNPGSSGSARWNILAGWAHATRDGGGDEAGKEFVTKFFENAVTLAASGREATTAFTGGTGDVLISYENEAIFARQAAAKNGDEPVEYIVPDDTLLIENPAAVTVDANPKAQEFLDFVLSDAGQLAFASKGFRPVTDVEVAEAVEGANDPEDPFPAPGNKLWTVADFGGWSEVNEKFFATAEKDGSDGIITQIQNASGKGTT